MMRVGIIGAGRMGRIRAAIANRNHSARVAVIADPVFQSAETLAASVGARAFGDWREAVRDADVDSVIVATPTIYHEEIAIAALRAGKHVLCEKPLARNVGEAEAIVAAAAHSGRTFKVGFNYRHLPHVLKAKALIDAGELGRIHFMRCHFGHGGRPGFEREWHASGNISGGGVLLEQGIHVLDLFRYLVGEPVKAFGNRPRYFWNVNGIEDNCFCLVETGSGQTGQIHISWTQWTNTFSLQLYGDNGFLHLLGRDGHYGPPTLTFARRNADHSRPREENFSFEAGRDWELEWQEFVEAVAQGRRPQGDAQDGLRAQQIIAAVYESDSTGSWVRLPERGLGIGK